MAYPDFVCMGFQKCGTTTLYELLRQHPSVALCRDVKEPMYYRIPGFSLLYGGHRFYRRRYFGHIKKGDKRLLGEVNAGLTFNGCIRRMSKGGMPPDTKLIFMMRNPVDRSYSAYKYFLARGFLPMRMVRYDRRHGHAEGFDRYVHGVLDDPRRRSGVMRVRQKYLVFSQSRYGDCIEEALTFFKPENTKYIIFEEFVRDERKICRELYDFLGIEDTDSISYSVKSNEGKERAVSPFRALEYFAAKAMNYTFYDLLFLPHWAPGLYQRYKKFFDAFRGKALESDPDRESMMPRTRRYLKAYFDRDIRKAEKLTGRNLRSVWFGGDACYD